VRSYAKACVEAVSGRQQRPLETAKGWPVDHQRFGWLSPRGYRPTGEVGYSIETREPNGVVANRGDQVETRRMVTPSARPA
jgi:hypothetical protein